MHSRNYLAVPLRRIHERTGRAPEGRPRLLQSGTAAIRLLDERDASAFRLLRLEALRELPDGFSPTYAEERDVPWTDYYRRFKEEWISGDNAIVGAFQGTRLVGAVGLRRWARVKQRHKAYIWILFVEPDARGSGTGRRLLNAVVAYARELEGLDQIQLSVSVESQSARSLYVSCGFESFGCERGALKVDDRSIDLELMALHFSESDAAGPACDAHAACVASLTSRRAVRPVH